MKTHGSLLWVPRLGPARDVRSLSSWVCILQGAHGRALFAVTPESAGILRGRASRVQLQQSDRAVHFQG